MATVGGHQTHEDCCTWAVETIQMPVEMDATAMTDGSVHSATCAQAMDKASTRIIIVRCREGGTVALSCGGLLVSEHPRFLHTSQVCASPDGAVPQDCD